MNDTVVSPQLVFIMGAGTMLLCICIVALSVAFVIFHKMWEVFSGFNNVNAKRDRGSIKVEADLKDKQALKAVSERRNGSGPLSVVNNSIAPASEDRPS